jgi:hypothetical protein
MTFHFTEKELWKRKGKGKREGGNSTHISKEGKCD